MKKILTVYLKFSLKNCYFIKEDFNSTLNFNFQGVIKGWTLGQLAGSEDDFACLV